MPICSLSIDKINPQGMKMIIEKNELCLFVHQVLII